MWLHAVFLWTLAVVLGLSSSSAQTIDHGLASSTTTSHGCVVTHVMQIPEQIPPVSTVYNVVMTTFHYAVDCRSCSVTNVNNGSLFAGTEGTFDARTTIPTLTVTRVGCLTQESTSTTRAGPLTGSNSYGKNILAIQTAETEPLVLENALTASKKDILRRGEMSSTATSLLHLAADFGQEIPPDIQQLPGQARDLLTAIWSAMFALNVADSGLNTTWACAQVQSIEVRYQLNQSWMNADQVTSLLCFIAQYGYNFNTTRAELYSALQAAVYALQVAGDFTNNRTEICENLDLFYRVGGLLGIDTARFDDYACKNIPSETPTSPNVYGPTPVVPLIPYPTNGTTSWGHPSSWEPRTTIWPTGGTYQASPTPKYPNTTIWSTGSLTTSSVATGYNSINTTSFQPSGTSTSSANLTWSATAGVGTGASHIPTNFTAPSTSTGQASSSNITWTQPTVPVTGTGSWSGSGNITSATSTTTLSNNTTFTLSIEPSSTSNLASTTPTGVILNNTVILGSSTTASPDTDTRANSGPVTSFLSDVLSPSSTGTGFLQEKQIMHFPPNPRTKTFYPAIEAPRPQRRGWFKRY